MSWCPDCGKNTLFDFHKESEPGVDKRCSNCGYVHYKQVKMTEDDLRKLIHWFLEHGLTVEQIAQRSGHTTEFIEKYATNQG